MKAGCDVWMYTPGFHHTKIIMVDGKFCTVGSANLNARSLRWDYEENAVIVDSCTTDQLDQLFNKEKKDSFLLNEKNWREWRTAGKNSRVGLRQHSSPYSYNTEESEGFHTYHFCK